METTTLEQAAESLLNTAPEASEGGDNLYDAVDEITEPDQDADGDEVDYAEEDEDDVEASDEEYDEEYDAEVDDEDQVEAAEDTTKLIPVKVDGKVEMWTLDQLKQSAAGQAAINKRFQEAAEARKQLEAHATALQQQQQNFLALQQAAQQGALQEPVPPSKELFESDPIGYMEEKIRYDEARDQYDAHMYQLRNMYQQNAQANEAAQRQYLQEQAEILRGYIPELADPEKGVQLKNQLVEVGEYYGFSSDEMSMVSDARYIRALNDARKYRQLQASRKKAQSKGENVRPVVKAGAKKRVDGNAATRKKAKSRLQKTGSITDALSLILDS